MFADAPFLCAVLVAIVGVSAWMERRFRWARTISASLLGILFGALLSNLGLVPAASPVYDFVWGPVTSLAIVWLLFAVDLRAILQAGPKLIFAFSIAVAGTATGAFAAAVFFRGSFPGVVHKLAGVLCGTYSGGSLNFVAVASELRLEEEYLAAATAADNIVTALWMGVCLILPRWFGSKLKAEEGEFGEPGSLHQAIDSSRATVTTVDLAALLAVGAVILWLKDALSGIWPAVPGVLSLTTIALIVGQMPWIRRLSGSMLLGVFSLNLLLTVIGVASRFAEIQRVGPAVLYITLTVVLVHGVITFGLGRLLRIDAGITAVASQAAIGGPSTAMALAVAKRWHSLAAPGVMIGLLGYAVGTYAGVMMAAWVERVVH